MSSRKNSAAAPNPRVPRAAGAPSAKTSRQYKKYGERCFDLSSTLAEFLSTNRIIVVDRDRQGGAAAEERVKIGVQLPGFLYNHKGFELAHKFAFIVGVPINLPNDEPHGQLVVPLCQSLLDGLGIDTKKMAPGDFVVRLPGVNTGDVISRELLGKYETFALSWVRSLRRSMPVPGTRIVAIDSPAATSEEILLESNFPWKSSNRSSNASKARIEESFNKRVEERKRLIKSEQEDDDSTDDSTDDSDDDDIQSILAKAGLALPASTVAQLARALTMPAKGKRAGKRRVSSPAPRGRRPQGVVAVARVVESVERPVKRARVQQPVSVVAPSPSAGPSSAGNSGVLDSASEGNSDARSINGASSSSSSSSSDADEFMSPEDREDHDLQRALRESIISNDPTSDPAEVSRKKVDNETVKKAGGVQAFAESVARAGASASSSNEDMCLGCYVARPNIVAHCAGADLREDKSYCPLMCDDCWQKRLTIRTREQCKSCDRCSGRLRHVYRYGKPDEAVSFSEIPFLP